MKDIDPDALAVLYGPVAPVAWLIEMAFDPVIRVCSAAVDIDWGGYTWLGAGPLGDVSSVKDSSNASESVTFTLSGVPTENIALALGESARNRLAKAYLAILHPETHAVLAAPLLWSGILDQMPISEDSSTSTVGVTSKHLGSLFSRIKPLRYTPGDQQKVSPGDTSMRFIAAQAVHQDVWPAAAWGRQ